MPFGVSVSVGDSLWISQLVLLSHYAVYVPVLMRDQKCTTAALWGKIKRAGIIFSLASAAVAYALHTASLWKMRVRTDTGIWLSTLLYFVVQTAFLPALRQAGCAGDPAYKLVTRAVLGAAAAAIAWYAWTVWRSKETPKFARVSSLYVLFHAAVVDFVYFGWWGVV